MPRARIVCIGNPYREEDWVGPAVHRILSARPLPDGIELIDGGLCGLDLLRAFDDAPRVVFADTLAETPAGQADWGEVDDPFSAADALRFDHAGGLGYLLRAAQATQPALPRVHVVGAGAGARPGAACAVATRCLELACHELTV